jgi:transmembrane sensor
MPPPNAHISVLLERLEFNTINREEFEQLLQWVDDNDNEAEFISLLEDAAARQQPGLITQEKLQEMWNSIEAKRGADSEGYNLTEKGEVVHRIHFLKTAWFRYAAAIILIVGIGSYLYITNQKEKPSVTQTSPVPVQNDVSPGGNRATLTLADGSKIILDSAVNGKLAEQGTAVIEKKDGQILYSRLPTADSRLPGTYNTMSTPRGGQYQITLSDGTQVWLNAESSITYPTAFTGKERNVTITGEAYFEVASDKKKPFKVTCHPDPEQREGEESAEDEMTIEVLGTHFNVNTYKEEPTINTTLIEGIVKLTALPTADSRLPNNKSNNKNAVHTSLILKPGQQGQFNPDQQKLSLAANPDVEQVMAWKNGLFHFESADLKTILAQFSRWYDIEVRYEGPVSKEKFFVIMNRNATLSSVLKSLRANDIRFRIEGRTLIVQNS